MGGGHPRRDGDRRQRRDGEVVGEQIGFDPAGALTGREVDDLRDEQSREAVGEVEVFARMSPGRKVRVLDALQGNDHRVAMTGDGVNDAPCVRNADVGIAMGQRGTDVTRVASDMVLRVDNVVTKAEGWGIFDNIRKFVNYLLSANPARCSSCSRASSWGARCRPIFSPATQRHWS